MRSGLFLALVALALVVGCASAPETVAIPEAEPPVQATVTVEPEEATVVTETESEVQAVESGPAGPDELPADSSATEMAPVEVSAEVYDSAFAEVEALIAELNQIIYRGDFRAWETYLTEAYITAYSDPAQLAAASKSPVLEQSGVVLRKLEDYFTYVVVPSRARARLDDLVFYSDTLVEAVSEFRGQKVILYLLRKTDGEWKIDTF